MRKRQYKKLINKKKFTRGFQKAMKRHLVRNGFGGTVPYMITTIKEMQKYLELDRILQKRYMGDLFFKIGISTMSIDGQEFDISAHGPALTR